MDKKITIPFGEAALLEMLTKKEKQSWLVPQKQWLVASKILSVSLMEFLLRF